MEKLQNVFKNFISSDMLAGVINFSLVLVNVVVVTTMWQQAGMPYNGAFTAVVLSALLGTFVAAYYRLSVAVAPGIVINTFLCYDLVICQGFSWQEAMSVPLLAGLGVLLLARLGMWEKLLKALPEYLFVCIPATVGVFLIYRGLVMAHLIITAPAQVTGIGSLNDPLVWVALPALLVVLYFIHRQREYALAAGLLTALGAAMYMGLFSWPEYPLSLPEGLLDTALQFTTGNVILLFGAVLVVFLVLVFEAVALGKLLGADCEKNLLSTNGTAALLGGLFSGGAMSVAEVTAACRFQGVNPRRAALISAGMLFLLLFCTPLALTMGKYTAISAAVVIGAGCLLLMDLKFLPINDNISILAGVFTIILVPVWGSLTAGIGFGLIIYSLLMVFNGRGRELSRLLIPIIGLFVIYFYYAV